jgi:MFS family permease/quinol monooxygenase YgiN
MTISTAWSPLRQSLFRALWIASIASNIGTWMQNVGGVWLMTSLTPSPLLIALMQTATSLPVFLVGLPAGALADIVDRRRLLLFWQAWMLVVAVVLSGLTFLGMMSPWLLLVLTFALGLGAAMNGPAWQAIVSELVSRPELPAAVALNSVGFNIARAVGPALGGLVVAASGPKAVFLLNAVSFVGVILVLYRWQRPMPPNSLPAERLVGAMRAGLRYVQYAPPLRAVLVRTAVFISCSSALWALLPLVAYQQLQLGASGYGILLGCLGIGAIAGAALMPRIRQRLSVNTLLILATIAFALATVVLAVLSNLVVVCVTLTMAGFAWLAILSNLNVATQVSVPAWVRARSLGVYQLVFQGGLAIGSAVWGGLAEQFGNQAALLMAAIGLLFGLLAAIRYRLVAGQSEDLTPCRWAEPVVMVEPHPEVGPVLITVEYQVEPQQTQPFVQAMHELSRSRKRDGAIRWGLFYDTANPERYVETFIVESWAEHLRQHERVTATDQAAQQRVRNFLVKKAPAKVTHLIYARNREVKAR